MALTPLDQAFQKTGSAFDQKLNNVLGVFQNLRASAMAKEQLAQNLSAQKEMMDYEYDKKVEVAQVQAKAAAQEAINESISDATKAVDKLNTQFSTSNYQNIDVWGLRPQVRPQVVMVDPENPQRGFKASLLDPEGNEISVPEYDIQLEKLDQYGKWLGEIEKNGSNLSPSTSVNVSLGGQPLSIETIGSDNVSNVISRIKTDPEYRDYYYQLYSNLDKNVLLSGKAEEPNAGDAINAEGRKLFSTIGSRKSAWNGNTNLPFLVDGQEVIIDYQQDVQSIQTNLENVVRSEMGADFKLGDIAKLNGVLPIIMAGDKNALSELGLTGDNNKQAKKLLELVKDNDSMKLAVSDYFAYEGVWSRLSNAANFSGKKSDYTLDWQSVPDFSNGINDLKKVLKKIEQNTQTSFNQFKAPVEKLFYG